MDMFPARIEGPDGIARNEVRLTDYGDRGFVVWAVGARGSIEPYLIFPPDSSTTVSRDEVHLTRPEPTADGDGTVERTWVLTKLPGCACGNPLKRRVPSYPETGETRTARKSARRHSTTSGRTPVAIPPELLGRNRTPRRFQS